MTAAGSTLDLAVLTYEEVRPILAAGAVALFPVGSTEAHGPHLGLGADVAIAQAAALRAAARFGEQGGAPGVRAALVLPALGYGVTDFARGFSGTLSVPSATVSALVRDVGRAALAAGFRALVVVNAHLEPAHIAAIRSAVETLRAEGLRAAFADNTKKPWALELGEEFRSGACHAGEYETSIVMAARPEMVREAVRTALEDNPRSLSEAIRAGRDSFEAAGGPRAYFGYPARAGADKGEQFLDALAHGIVEAAREVVR